jgi:hypothetical protein
MLSAPWEYGERQLRYFNFATQSFQDGSSRNLFARKGLNSKAVENWLNKIIETPAAAHATRLRRKEVVIDVDDWRTQRALALLFFLNSQRLQEARSKNGVPITLEAMQQQGEVMADEIARFVFQSFKLLSVRVPNDTELFFTETATFAFPMPESPVLAVPLGLKHALLAYEGPLSAKALLENIHLRTLAMFSIGVGRNVNRVVLPPTWRDGSLHDESDIRRRLLEIREGAQKIFNLVGKASLSVGLCGWEVT